MKTVICLLVLGCLASLSAEEEPADELPEPSEPPFAVGDFPMESGYTVEREDAPDLNFRIVADRMRLYWIDEDGLIMEPEVPEISVRFDGRSLNEPNRSFFRFERVSGDTALGSPYVLPVPHNYIIILLVKPPDSEEVASYRFRYLPAMDKVTTPEPKEESK